MSDTYTLIANVRDRVGKGAARELRRNAQIPAVIYGDKKDPLSIAIQVKEVTKLIHSGGFMTTIGTIEVDGKKHKVLAKDFQMEPIKDFITHVDFLRISASTTVTVDVPVHFENEEECKGIKKGGVLNIVRHTVEVNCPADSIPENFTVDLLNFDLGDAVKVSEFTMPKGVEPTITDRDFTIATIASPAGLKSEGTADDAEEGDAAEGAAEAE